MKKCRYCAEEIQDAAIICRFCGRSTVAPSPTVPADSKQLARAREWKLLKQALLWSAGVIGLIFFLIMLPSNEPAATKTEPPLDGFKVARASYSVTVMNESRSTWTNVRVLAWSSASDADFYEVELASPIGPGEQRVIPLREFLSRAERFPVNERAPYKVQAFANVDGVLRAAAAKW